MSEKNPNHGVTAEVREHWHKFCALVMFKMGLTSIEITSQDIETFVKSPLKNITVRPIHHVITLTLVDDEEAERLLDKEGGRPI